MHLKEQQYVLAVAQSGNITKAAARLGITQPALSAFLTNLEQSLGTQLFDRVNKKLTPTYTGQLYIEAAQKMLSLKAEFDQQVSDINNEQRGRLRIGLQIRRSPIVLPSFYTAFQRLYPKVEISFVEGVIQYLEDLLEDDQLDLVLCNKYHESDKFQYIHIADEQLLMATAKNHPLAVGTRYIQGSDYPWIDLRRFASETFILQRSNQSQRIFSDRILRQLNIVPKHILLVQNIEASTRLAASGAGISFALDSYAKYFRFTPEPAYYHVGSEPVCVQFVAYHKKGAYLPSFVDTAIEIIRSVV